ncbi:MAG: histidine triad nucleotide-binding protein [Dehalococcoidia bacterium]|nr:histidine triad nucleotide-binding protein [Dehalococcoidia bacterium]
MEQDIFCQIAEGVIPTTKFYDDTWVLAFADISPLAPIHILIVPKKHFTSLNDLGGKDEGLLGHMILVAQRLAKEHGVALSGYRLIINCGPHGRQVVPHLHLHLLGGRELTAEMC